MTPIKEYMFRKRDDRRSHLNLDTSCKEIGGTSKEFKGLLAYHLGTTIPTGRAIHLCHACHNAKCSNVGHLYWGSPKDNSIDCVEDRGTVWERTIAKHGFEEATRVLSENSKKHGSLGGHGNAGKPKSPGHRAKIAASLRKTKVEVV